MVEESLTCPLTRGERILVALDGSDYSQAAVDQAISLGDVCNSQIYLISVVDLFPDQMEVAPNLVEKMSAEARERLDAGKAKVDKAGIACETIVRMGGKPHQFIVEEAKANEIDLICMGTLGKSGLSRFLIGSVAQNVLAHAPCPVLVVPAMA